MAGIDPRDSLKFYATNRAKSATVGERPSLPDLPHPTQQQTNQRSAILEALVVNARPVLATDEFPSARYQLELQTARGMVQVLSAKAFATGSLLQIEQPREGEYRVLTPDTDLVRQQQLLGAVRHKLAETLPIAKPLNHWVQQLDQLVAKNAFQPIQNDKQDNGIKILIPRLHLALQQQSVPIPEHLANWVRWLSPSLPSNTQSIEPQLKTWQQAMQQILRSTVPQTNLSPSNTDSPAVQSSERVSQPMAQAPLSSTGPWKILPSVPDTTTRPTPLPLLSNLTTLIKSAGQQSGMAHTAPATTSPTVHVDGQQTNSANGIPGNRWLASDLFQPWLQQVQTSLARYQQIPITDVKTPNGRTLTLQTPVLKELSLALQQLPLAQSKSLPSGSPVGSVSPAPSATATTPGSQPSFVNMVVSPSIDSINKPVESAMQQVGQAVSNSTQKLASVIQKAITGNETPATTKTPTPPTGTTSNANPKEGTAQPEGRVPLQLLLLQLENLLTSRLQKQPDSLEQKLKAQAAQLLNQSTGLYHPTRLTQAATAGGQKPTPPTPLTQGLESLLTDVRQAVARVQVQQLGQLLAQVASDDQAPFFQQFEIPINLPGVNQPLTLEVRHLPDENENNKKSAGKKRQWHLRLHMEMPPLSPWCAELFYQPNPDAAGQLDLIFWSEDPFNLQLFTLYQPTLNKNLSERGFEMGRVESKSGLPKRSDPETWLQQELEAEENIEGHGMVDVRT